MLIIAVILMVLGGWIAGISKKKVNHWSGALGLYGGIYLLVIGLLMSFGALSN